MELVQARIVTGGVQRLAAFYAWLVQAEEAPVWAWTGSFSPPPSPGETAA